MLQGPTAPTNYGMLGSRVALGEAGNERILFYSECSVLHLKLYLINQSEIVLSHIP